MWLLIPSTDVTQIMTLKMTSQNYTRPDDFASLKYDKWHNHSCNSFGNEQLTLKDLPSIRLKRSPNDLKWALLSVFLLFVRMCLIFKRTSKNCQVILLFILFWPMIVQETKNIIIGANNGQDCVTFFFFCLRPLAEGQGKEK